MKAGKLRHRVTLQTGTQTRNSAGQFTTTWADTATYWAKVKPLFGSEADAGSEQQRAVRNHAVTMRAGPSISPRQRFSFDGRTLNITSVHEVNEAGRELLIICREEVTS